MSNMDELIYKATLALSNAIKSFKFDKVGAIIMSDEFPKDYAITDCGISAIGLAASLVEKDHRYGPNILKMLNIIAKVKPDYNHRDNFGRAPIHYSSRCGGETAT